MIPAQKILRMSSRPTNSLQTSVEKSTLVPSGRSLPMIFQTGPTRDPKVTQRERVPRYQPGPRAGQRRNKKSPMVSQKVAIAIRCMAPRRNAKGKGELYEKKCRSTAPVAFMLILTQRGFSQQIQILNAASDEPWLLYSNIVQATVSLGFAT